VKLPLWRCRSGWEDYFRAVGCEGVSKGKGKVVPVLFFN
jgi:hypothetical protein